jgi:hypothetical protein
MGTCACYGKRRPCNHFSITPPANNRKAVGTSEIIQIDQAARPHNTPKDAVIQIVAAVERPCTTWRPVARCRITPAPKNPTPVTTPWMTLLASTADARATSPSVRIPVGRSVLGLPYGSPTLALSSKCLARSDKSSGRAETTKGRPTEVTPPCPIF